MNSAKYAASSTASPKDVSRATTAAGVAAVVAAAATVVVVAAAVAAVVAVAVVQLGATGAQLSRVAG